MKNKNKSFVEFEKIYKTEWNRLRNVEGTIFENFNISLDVKNEYSKFKKSPMYLNYLNENSNYEKKKK